MSIDATTYVEDTPDEVFMSMLERATARDPGLRSVTVMPNWSREWLKPPSGYVAEFDSKAPFVADHFYRDMWSATCVVEVLEVDEAAIRAAEINARVPSVSARSPPFTDSDMREWDPCIGDTDNYIGLYNADRTNPRTQMTEKIWMIITKCSLHPESLEAMEAYFTKCEADGLTYRQVFHNNKELEQFRALAMRNRRRVCYQFAEAIGATIRFRTYSKSATPCKIANLVCETETNFVRFHNDDMYLYAGCTCTTDVTDGLVFNRAPLLGPLIYIGPNTKSVRDNGIFGGQKWYNKMHDAFPTSNRPNISKSTWEAFTRLGFSQGDLAKTLVCDGELQTNALLLRTYPYRKSTDRSVEIKAALGYDFKNAAQSIVVCRPVVVKMCL